MQAQTAYFIYLLYLLLVSLLILQLQRLVLLQCVFMQQIYLFNLLRDLQWRKHDYVYEKISR